MKIKTQELTGAALDYAVLIADQGEDAEWYMDTGLLMEERGEVSAVFQPSVRWAQGGPIIEREGIRWNKDDDVFYAWTPDHEWFDPLHEPMIEYDPGVQWRGFAYGDTLLVAAMRCFVASELGDEVDIPEELLK